MDYCLHKRVWNQALHYTKIQVVQNCNPPKSKEELISFLQMVAYLS